LIDGDNSGDNGPAPDPHPNSDTCNGGSGHDTDAFCESETSIESHF
jgi:hypothetical protein